MDPLAEKYDEDLRLAHKLKNKAKFILKINNRNNKKNENSNKYKNIKNVETQMK